MTYLGGQGGYFEKMSYGSETWLAALSNKNMKNMSISFKKEFWGPPYPPNYDILGRKGGVF